MKTVCSFLAHPVYCTSVSDCLHKEISLQNTLRYHLALFCLARFSEFEGEQLFETLLPFKVCDMIDISLYENSLPVDAFSKKNF